MADVRAGIRCWFADGRWSRIMRQSATRQPWHQEYAFVGWIPTGISVVVMQIRSGCVVYHAAEHDWAFAEDFLVAGSPVDFR